MVREVNATTMPSAVILKSEPYGLFVDRSSENTRSITAPLPAAGTEALTSVGAVVSAAAATVVVATLVAVSALLASSLKVTFTLIFLPRSPASSM